MAADNHDFDTLANVKQYIDPNLPSPGPDDNLLQAMITAMSRAMARYCVRNILAQVFTEVRNGTGQSVMRLINWPVVSVTSLTIGTTIIQAATSPTTRGYVNDKQFIYFRDGEFCRGLQNISIVYTAGFNTPGMVANSATVAGAPNLPNDFVLGLDYWVKLVYKQRDLMGLKSSGVGPERLDFNLNEMPPALKTMLNPHREVVPVDAAMLTNDI